MTGTVQNELFSGINLSFKIPTFSLKNTGELVIDRVKS